MTFIVNIRDRRQITLPSDILNRLDLSVGDSLSIQIKKQELIIKPIREQAMDTLKTIQKVFQKAKIGEGEVQKAGRELRRKLSEEMYER